MTNWAKMRDYLSSKEVGYIFSWKEIHDKFHDIADGSQVAYISLLRSTKFVERIGRGQFKIVAEIPKTLTMGNVNQLMKGDNLSYIESLQKQKGDAILKEQFLLDRRRIIKQLLDELNKVYGFIINSDYLKVGLNANYFRYQIREWKKEFEADKRPTKQWLLYQNIKDEPEEIK